MRNVGHVVTEHACNLAGATGAAPPASSGFPAKYDRSQVVVRLERGQGCMGCAVYSVTVRADGTVAYEGRSGYLPRIKADPVFEPLHGEPQYQRLVQAIGLGEVVPSSAVTGK